MRRFFSSFLSAVGKKRGRRRQDKTATSQGVHKRKCGRSSRCVSVYPPIFGLPKDRGISLLFSGRMLFYFFGFSGHTAKKSMSRSISSPTFDFAINCPPHQMLLPHSTLQPSCPRVQPSQEKRGLCHKPRPHFSYSPISAGQVSSPTMPSTARPRSRWKLRAAVSAFTPNSLSLPLRSLG